MLIWGPATAAATAIRLSCAEQSAGIYAYRELDFKRALGLGSAYGEEYLSIVERITILYPSDVFPVASIKGASVVYRKPLPSGGAPFSDGAFDLVLCFGVPHHKNPIRHHVRRKVRHGVMVNPAPHTKFRTLPTAWNHRYHRETLAHRLPPSGGYRVLNKKTDKA